MIVVDTALISYLLIPGEFTDQVERVRSLDSDWIAPRLWISEFRSVLRKFIVSGKISVELATDYAYAAQQLMRGRDFDVDSAHVLTLVSATRCSSYDCEFVALARAANIPLVTTDREVLASFPRVAVHPSDFGSP